MYHTYGPGVEAELLNLKIPFYPGTSEDISRLFLEERKKTNESTGKKEAKLQIWVCKLDFKLAFEF